MTDFKNRLKKLRKESNYNQKDMANFLGISASAYGFYEQGRTSPNIEVLETLSNLFSVSIDYLTGNENKEYISDITLQTRLKELRKENKFTQEDIAKKLNMTTSGYGYYEQGRTYPPIEILNEIANIYSVSVDYLLGNTTTNLENNSTELSILIGFRIKSLREMHNITQTELGNKLNVSKATISKYESGKVEPSIASLISLSKLFNVSIDFLLDNNVDFENTYDYRLKNLSDKEKQLINDFIDFVVSKSTK